MKVINVGNDFMLAQKLKSIKAKQIVSEPKKEAENGNIPEPAEISSGSTEADGSGEEENKVGSVEKKSSGRRKKVETTSD